AEQTRVFTPKNADSEDLLRAIEDLLDRTAALNAPREGGPGIGQPPMGVLPPPVGPINPGPGIGPMGLPPGVGALGGDGMIGGFGGLGGGGAMPGHVSRLAHDSRTGSIVIRGPASEVQL